MVKIEPLNEQAILNLMDDINKCTIELELHQQLDSTNAYLMQQPVSKKTRICLAESQTDGRGRYGKNWYSPAKSNIYLSISHCMKKPISELSGLSLVIGLSLSRTLQAYCHDKIAVKWPNDLMVDNRKLSGILLELKKHSDGLCQVIIGIGINVSMSETAVNTISQPWTSLSQCHPIGPLSRNIIVANLLKEIIDNLTLFENSGFKQFSHQWNNLDIWYKKEVELLMGKDIVAGIHKGVDLNGALLLECDDKITAFSSGQVSLRRATNAVTD
ncbi:MAG: biotin--[acetyl-CoA-carboxylase] ligase [Gammaproteobacteria bacterium]|nr:biotin--[acetyl-CoA-carboxylase] ligase [Gammaproteobacteria bacterium]